MLVDVNQIQPEQTLHTELCIIGGGAAGITIAREFANSGRKVLLLEGGGSGFSDQSQNLYKGTLDGPDIDWYSEHYLYTSRLRYFGGSTNHWVGICRPLSPIDFQKRDWVPNSGWPIDHTDLLPFHERTASVLKIPRFKLTEDDASAQNDPAFLNESTQFAKIHYYLSPPVRFGQTYGKDLVESRNVRVCLNASVTQIETNPEVQSVNRLEVRKANGQRFWVSPKQVILAAGGVENARLLLLSNRQQPTGLGNHHDVVGRYFMEHIETRLGYICSGRQLPEYFQEQGLTWTLFSPRWQVLTANHWLGSSIQIEANKPILRGDWTEAYNQGNRFTFGSKEGLRRDHCPYNLGDVWDFWANDKELYQNKVMVRAEQSPNPDNRVELSDQKDALGLSRSRLVFRITEDDKQSIMQTVTHFARELGILGEGRFNLRPPDKVWQLSQGGNHHMGTTRMHHDPKQGVVNANCRVHGIDNLFIAGSSVFTTSGYANPTYTIVLLALRLSDHLKSLG